MQEGDILSNTQCACSKIGMKKVFCNMNPLKYYTKDKLSTLKLNKQCSKLARTKQNVQNNQFQISTLDGWHMKYSSKNQNQQRI